MQNYEELRKKIFEMLKEGNEVCKPEHRRTDAAIQTQADKIVDDYIIQECREELARRIAKDNEPKFLGFIPKFWRREKC
jgi:GTPase Era involved in 16S rRNA processing